MALSAKLRPCSSYAPTGDEMLSPAILAPQPARRILYSDCVFVFLAATQVAGFRCGWPLVSLPPPPLQHARFKGLIQQAAGSAVLCRSLSEFGQVELVTTGS